MLDSKTFLPIRSSVGTLSLGSSTPRLARAGSGYQEKDQIRGAMSITSLGVLAGIAVTWERALEEHCYCPRHDTLTNLFGTVKR